MLLLLLILGIGKFEFGKWKSWDFDPRNLSPALGLCALDNFSWFIKLRKKKKSKNRWEDIQEEVHYVNEFEWVQIHKSKVNNLQIQL